MGCGCGKGVAVANVLVADNLTYPRQVSLAIRERSPANEVTKTTPFNCTLPAPAFLHTEEVFIGATKVFVSACVLPGLDPRGKFKHCQDRFLVAYDGQRLLTGILDGHGGQGHDCAELIAGSMSSQFLTGSDTDKSEGCAFLTRITAKAGEDLMSSQTDCRFSGSTATMLMIDNQTISASCVGDSRACIGSLEAPPKDIYEIENPHDAKAPCLQLLQQVRKFPPSQLSAVKLVKESKPEDPDEMFRIFKAGGKVDRLKTSNGEPYGAYRVIGKSKDTPGLGMSRSIGDLACHESGVISTPHTSHRPFTTTKDYLCVIGSDGVWDVLDNQEVIDFVEAYRSVTRRDQAVPVSANAQECTIAQLLCEEARLRWLTLAQQEDEQIDDISAVVVELRPPVSAAETVIADEWKEYKGSTMA
jgi:serine/threonine protein phosphatase PrpC